MGEVLVSLLIAVAARFWVAACHLRPAPGCSWWPASSLPAAACSSPASWRSPGSASCRLVADRGVAPLRCADRRVPRRPPRHRRGALVVDDNRPDAFTTPQPAGRIVITTGLLKALTAGERQVVLAHETCHLRHRHAWWLLVADLAAAANPLLRPTARSAERWADEDAATAVGNRRLAARTLARVALLTRNPDLADRFALAATGGDVPDRVRALLAPPPPARPASIAALAALLMVM